MKEAESRTHPWLCPAGLSVRFDLLAVNHGTSTCWQVSQYQHDLTEDAKTEGYAVCPSEAVAAIAAYSGPGRICCLSSPRIRLVPLLHATELQNDVCAEGFGNARTSAYEMNPAFAVPWVFNCCCCTGGGRNDRTESGFCGDGELVPACLSVIGPPWWKMGSFRLHCCVESRRRQAIFGRIPADLGTASARHRRQAQNTDPDPQIVPVSGRPAGR